MTTSGGANFRGAQASVGTGRTFAGTGSNFAGRSSGQFAQGGFRGDRFHHRGFGPGLGFAAGVGVGSALGYGYGGYYDPYYYDDYAYDDSYPAYSGYVVSGGADPSYCAQRYRSYDPASGTYLGFDGLRHPCP
jgi:BA14K-like protein